MEGSAEEGHREITLGEGVELGYQGTVKRYAAELTDIVELVLTVGASVPASVAANLITNWLYAKFKHNRPEKLIIEREEIELDDEERVRRIVREKISQENTTIRSQRSELE